MPWTEIGGACHLLSYSGVKCEPLDGMGEKKVSTK
jgi:hypothetical protein